MAVLGIFLFFFIVVLPSLYLVLTVCGWFAPRRWLFMVLHIPAVAMGGLLSVTVPPLFFVGHAFLLAVLYAPRFACVGVISLNGIPLGLLFGTLVIGNGLKALGIYDYLPWVAPVPTVLLLGWLGWRYTGGVTRKNDVAGNGAALMRRSLLRGLVVVGMVLLAVGQLWEYRVPIATQVARVGSPALSSALLRVGGIPRAPQEDALFMQARAQGTQADFLRTMLRARAQFGFSGSNVASSGEVLEKLFGLYASPELAEQALDFLLEQEGASPLPVWQVLDLARSPSLWPLLHKHGQLVARELVSVEVLLEHSAYASIDLPGLFAFVLDSTPPQERQELLLAPDNGGDSPMSFALGNSVESASFAAVFLPYVPKTPLMDSRGQTVLHMAAQGNSQEKLELVLRHVGMNALGFLALHDNQGFAPLHYAALETYGEGVALLVGQGATVNAQDAEGQTPFFYSCTTSLADSGQPYANILAIEEGNAKPAVLRMLLAVPGAEVNVQDSHGRTPLHYACLINNLFCEDNATLLEHIVQPLLHAGAAPLAQNNAGETAYDFWVQQWQEMQQSSPGVQQSKPAMLTVLEAVGRAGKGPDL